MRNRLNSFLARFVGALGVVFGFVLAAEAQILRVTPAGGGDGTSWESPASLSAAISAATTAGDEILLAAGDYTVAAQLEISKPIAIRGGYEGTDDTTLAANPVSTLNALDNSAFTYIFKVSTGTGAATTNVFERLCVTRGYERGLYKTGNAALVCTDCRFYRNGVRRSGTEGGGVYLKSAGLTEFKNCLFDGNAHTNWFNKNTQLIGAGIRADTVTRIVLDTCNFYTNCVAPNAFQNWLNVGQDSGDSGSAIYANNAPVVARGCNFVGNRNHGRSNRGAAVALFNNCHGSSFTNCAFYGNRTLGADNDKTGFGAPLSVALGSAARTVDVYGCTFAYNYCRASTSSAGLHVRSGKAVVRNTIFYGNHLEESVRTSGYGSDISTEAAGCVDIDYSLVTGAGTSYFSVYNAANLTLGEHMTYGDPLFGTTLADAKTAVGGNGSSDVAAILAFNLHEGGLGSGYSCAIDGGTGDYATEPAPNGGRRNLGLYGNTASAATSQLGTPAFLNDAINISFADDTKPTVSVTLAGSGTYNAWVKLEIATNDFEQGGVTAAEFVCVSAARAGDTVTLAGNGLYPTGNALYVRATLDAPGFANPVVKYASKTVTGTLPYHYGHGGGATVLHVRAGANGLNTGANWTDAYPDLNAAIDALKSTHAEIWISGTLTPTLAPKTLTATVPLVIRGGFEGDEDSLADRPAGTYSTIDGQDRYSCMVLSNGDKIPVTVERMILTRASNNGLYKSGHGNLTLADCQLLCNGHVSGNYGRGLCVVSGSKSVVSVTNCIFRGNYQRNNGGGSCRAGAIYANGIARVFVDDSTFVTNGANPACGRGESHAGRDNTDGGCLWMNGVPITARNCRFTGNRGGVRNIQGGVILLDGAAGGSAFTNCVFAGNMCCYATGDSQSTRNTQYYGLHGGAVCIDLSSNAGTVDFEKCTIAYNTSSSFYTAGGLDVVSGTVSMHNSIVYGNAANALCNAPFDIVVWTNGTLNLSHVWLTSEEGTSGLPTSGTVRNSGGTLTTDHLSFGDPEFATSAAAVAAQIVQDGYYSEFKYATAADRLFFADIDVHLSSPGGRYDNTGTYRTDDVRASTAIDKGDPDDPTWANEPTPNGSRVNLGGYAGTKWASKTLEAQPEIKDDVVNVTFPYGYSRPTISFTMGGEGAYFANVEVCCTTGDVAAAGYAITNRQNGVVNGATVTIPLPDCYVAGDTLSWRVWITADKAQDREKTGTATITGAIPPFYGKGGGAHVIHVWPSVQGGQRNGGNWWDAYATIEEAEAALSETRNEIWYCVGTNQLAATLTNPRAYPIAYRGGFTGLENSPSERPAGSRSFLTGDRNTILTINNAAKITVDGFRIEGGKQRGIEKSGNGDFDLVACDIACNGVGSSYINGRGMYLSSSSSAAVAISNCVFQGNAANNGLNSGYGMALYAPQCRSLTIDGTLFLTNGVTWSAGNGYYSPGRDLFYGAAIYATTPIVVRNTRFVANRATCRSAYGGCVYLAAGAAGSVFDHCLWVGNDENYGWSSYDNDSVGSGALIVNLGAAADTVRLEHCTLAYNHSDAKTSGGGMTVLKGTAAITNSIFYGNFRSLTSTGGRDLTLTDNGFANVAYTLFSGEGVEFVKASLADNLQLGAGVKFGDPSFVTPIADVESCLVGSSVPRRFDETAADTVSRFDVHLLSRDTYRVNRDLAGSNGATNESAEVMSAAIDAADPAADYSHERRPHGNVANLGFYGNTDGASTTPIGQPEITDVDITFPAPYSRPRIVVTLGGKAGVLYSATVTVTCKTGGVAVATQTYTMVAPGDSVTHAPGIYFVNGDTLTVEVSVSAPGAETRVSAPTATVTGNPAPWSGKGGPANVIHVRAGADGNATGENWTDAYPDLALAISKLGVAKNELWIAGDFEVSQTLALTPATDVMVRGGFTGSENAAAERGADTMSVVDGLATRPSASLFSVANAAGTVTFDRITVQRAFLHGLSKSGAGALVCTDCRFTANSQHVVTDNYNSNLGGGAYLTAGAVAFTNCLFDGNMQTNFIARASCLRGGAIYAQNLSRLTLEGCTFVTNGVPFDTNLTREMGQDNGAGGAALYANNVPVTARNCRFLANRTPGRTYGAATGGTVCLYGNSSGSLFEHCVFAGNETTKTGNSRTGLGAALCVSLAQVTDEVTVRSCTVAYNHADGADTSAGIVVEKGSVVLRDSIVYGNTVGLYQAANFGQDIVVKTDGRFDMDYSLVTGRGMPSVSTINALNLTEGDHMAYGDPLFGTDHDAYTNLFTNIPAWQNTYRQFKTDAPDAILAMNLHENVGAGAGSYSRAIDTADPSSAYAEEPSPNGGRRNLGVYGNTSEAAASQSGVPAVPDGNITIMFAENTCPTVSVTLGGSGAYNVQAEIALATNTFAHATEVSEYDALNGLQNGETFAFSGANLYTPGSTLYVRVTLTGGGLAQPLYAYASATVTGELPFHYGHGGGPTVVHVREGAAGAATGANWTDAFPDMISAFAAVTADKAEMWIAGKIEVGIAPNKFMPAGPFVIRGGFRGDEDRADQRRAGWRSEIDGRHAYDVVIVENAESCPLMVERMVFSRAVNRGFEKSGRGDITFVDCLFVANGPAVDNSGRGLYMSGSSVASATISNCQFLGNAKFTTHQGTCYGAAITAESLKRLTVDDTLFVTNGASWNVEYGWGIPGHDAPNGAAVYLNSVPTTMRNCRFVANRGGIRGDRGGVFRMDGNCDGSAFTNCLWMANSNTYAEGDRNTHTGVYGGCIVIAQDNAARRIEFENCTIAYNLGDANGVPGGLDIVKGTVKLHNSIVWNNVCGQYCEAAADFSVRDEGSLELSWTRVTGFGGDRFFKTASGTIVTNDHVTAGDPEFFSSTSSFTNHVRTTKGFGVAEKDNYTYLANAAADIAYYLAIDGHLASRAGYLDAQGIRHRFHGARRSNCLDAGDPASAWTNEPEVNGVGSNGRRINLGCYGNTPEATLTPVRGAFLRVR